MKYILTFQEIISIILKELCNFFCIILVISKEPIHFLCGRKMIFGSCKDWEKLEIHYHSSKSHNICSLTNSDDRRQTFCRPHSSVQSFPTAVVFLCTLVGKDSPLTLSTQPQSSQTAGWLLWPLDRKYNFMLSIFVFLSHSTARQFRC